MKHHSNDSNNNSVMHEAEKGSNNEKQMDQGWGKEREHDIPILFLTSSIEDVEKSNFIINNALLSIRVFFGKKKNVSSARRGDARFFLDLPSIVGSYSSTKWLWMNWMVNADFPTPGMNDQNHKITVHYIRAHRHHQRQRVCILAEMRPVQPVKALDFFEYTKQQKVNGSREHGIHEGRRGSRSLQVWTTYSGGSICSHVRVMYNTKERDVREGAEGTARRNIRSRPNTPKFDAIKGGYCVSSHCSRSEFC